MEEIASRTKVGPDSNPYASLRLHPTRRLSLGPSPSLLSLRLERHRNSTAQFKPDREAIETQMNQQQEHHQRQAGVVQRAVQAWPNPHPQPHPDAGPGSVAVGLL